jgi:hypothetical protein
LVIRPQCLQGSKRQVLPAARRAKDRLARWKRHAEIWPRGDGTADAAIGARIALIRTRMPATNDDASEDSSEDAADAATVVGRYAGI